MSPQLSPATSVFTFLLAASSMVISAQAEAPRIVLVGDSTVSPNNGWGDGFAKYLAPGVECLNMAQPGRSSKSFREEGHWQKVLDAKPTWVLIQFGHNDQPGKGPLLETDAETTFRENLGRYIDEAREIGANPVLITSLTRRYFDKQGKIINRLLAPYAEATRIVAAEKKVPLIDLNALSIEQMNQLGPEAALAFDKSKTEGKRDGTHLSPYGEAETAKLVAAEIRKVAPELGKLLAEPDGE